MFRQTGLRSATLAATLCALAAYAILGGFFDREIVIEIAILALLAVSLDLVAGFGGMISLCHGAIYGIAAYGFAATTVKLGLGDGFGMLVGLAFSVLFGLVVGAVAASTSGIFFIMATLAFGQMVYVGVFRWGWLGGDDGLPGVPRISLDWLGIDLMNSLNYALFALAVLALGYMLAAQVLRSAFGRTLSGIHANEARMRAIGVNTRRHKAMAFGLSSFLAGLAGLLAAQHTQFVSPGLLHWMLSGEVLVVVILGGLGTLVGPVVGAALFVLLKHEVSSHTNYWHIVVGGVLIAAVLAGGRGIFGEIEYRLGRGRAHRSGDDREAADA